MRKKFIVSLLAIFNHCWRWCVGWRRNFKLLCSSRTGFSFFFCPNKRKTKQKENSPAAFFYLLRCFSTLNKKNSLSLKQLFVFYAPKSTCALRWKKEAGAWWFRNIASLVDFLGATLLRSFFLCNFASLVARWYWGRWFLGYRLFFFVSARILRILFVSLQKERCFYEDYIRISPVIEAVQGFQSKELWHQ